MQIGCSFRHIAPAKKSLINDWQESALVLAVSAIESEVIHLRFARILWLILHF